MKVGVLWGLGEAFSQQFVSNKWALNTASFTFVSAFGSLSPGNRLVLCPGFRLNCTGYESV